MTEPTNLSARGIVSRALIERRDDFNAELRRRGAADRTYMDTVGVNGAGYRGARASAWAGDKVQTWADCGDIDALVSECGPMVIALNIACKVLDIPAHVRTAAAVDWQEKQGN